MLATVTLVTRHSHAQFPTIAGLISAAPGKRNSSLQTSARQVEQMVRVLLPTAAGMLWLIGRSCCPAQQACSLVHML